MDGYCEEVIKAAKTALDALGQSSVGGKRVKRVWNDEKEHGDRVKRRFLRTPYIQRSFV
jgi:hypothetical protein